jgi:hypothetical protein
MRSSITTRAPAASAGTSSADDPSRSVADDGKLGGAFSLPLRWRWATVPPLKSRIAGVEER